MLRHPRPVRLPDPRRPAWEGLERAARSDPERIALIQSNGVRITFGDLWANSRRMATVLQRDLGLAPGETLAVVASSTREFAATVYGAWLLGASVMPINRGLKWTEVGDYLSQAKATGAVVSGAAQLEIEDAVLVGALPSLPSTITAEEVWDRAQHARQLSAPTPIDSGADLALLPYSSGTSGPPKCVRLSHANLVAATDQLIAMGQIHRDSVILSLRVFVHAFRLCAAAGATCVTQLTLDPEESLSLIRQAGVTHMFLRPSYLRALCELQRARPVDVSSLRLIETAGEPISSAMQAAAARLFGCPVVQGYHLTETSGAANRPVAPLTPLGSIGPPTPGTLERIIDLESGDDVAPGSEGELLIQGPQVMGGYLGPVAEPSPFVDDGWLRTGDLARQDDRQNVRIVDRVKELIKVNGHQVAPAELEQVLLLHPAVEEALVRRSVLSDGTEQPRAWIVLRKPLVITPEALAQFARDHLAPYKAIGELRFVDALPKSSGGKTRRADGSS